MLPTVRLPKVDTGPFEFTSGLPGAKIGWRPDPRNKPQCDAYTSEAFETLYGGAAGGGKTDLILGLARIKHRRSLVLRREFPDLERSVISRSLEFYGERRFYNASKHVWLIDGRRIEFGHMERQGTPQLPGDEAQYASAPYDYIAFDQLEQFGQYPYEFMFSRARTTKPGQRVRIVATANWVGEGVQWILERWAAWLDESHPNPARPGELRWYYRLKGDTRERDAPGPEPIFDDKAQDWVTPKSRTFIPAKLKDNPYLNEDYKASLQALPEPLRSALLDGEISVMLADDAYQVIPRAWVKAAQARWTPDRPPGKAIWGVDVARGGDDSTVMVPRVNNWYGMFVKRPGSETPTGQSVSALMVAHMAAGDSANLDVIGVGSSAYDFSCEVLPVNPVNFSEHSSMTDKSGRLHFVNKRAEYYWRMREALDPASGRDVALPPSPALLGDLCAPRWEMRTNGVKIEDKEEIKKRLGRSPDEGDAAVLAMESEATYFA